MAIPFFLYSTGGVPAAGSPGFARGFPFFLFRIGVPSAAGRGLTGAPGAGIFDPTWRRHKPGQPQTIRRLSELDKTIEAEEAPSALQPAKLEIEPATRERLEAAVLDRFNDVQNEVLRKRLRQQAVDEQIAREMLLRDDEDWFMIQ